MLQMEFSLCVRVGGGMGQGEVGWSTVFILCFIALLRPTNKSWIHLLL